MSQLFSSFLLGDTLLKNRIVMAPMTRGRALENGTPSALSALYYEQRASSGLIITEGVNVSLNSMAFDRSPGIYSESQIKAWKNITEKVHQANGKIFLQLWHSGRVSAKALLKGKMPLSPSAIDDDLHELRVFGLLANGFLTQILASPSKEMIKEEIKETIQEYAKAAENATKAGFDGVEIHGANGYLIHQFLASNTNHRRDEYGGSVQKRAQFLKEVIEAILQKVDSKKVGLRLSPFALYNHAIDEFPDKTFAFVAKMADEYKLAYIHASDTNALMNIYDMSRIMQIIKPHYSGPIIGCGGIDPLNAEKLIEEGTFDLIAFGRSFIANPDLPRRIKEKGPFNKINNDGLYFGGKKGYTDYPFLDSQK